MTFSPRIRILPVLLALLLSTGVHAEPEDRAAEVRKQLRVDTYKDVSYFDENKNEITSEQFDQRIRGGAYVSMSKTKNWFGTTIVKMRLDTKPSIAFKAGYKIKAGDQFPAFSHMMLTNKPFTNKELLGKYSVVSFYFADCAPCITEIPELNALAASRADMNHIGITFDPVKTTRKFVDEHKLGWILLSDAKPTLDALGVTMYPTLALLDPEGKVIAIEPGHAIKKSDKTIAAWIERLAPQARN